MLWAAVCYALGIVAGVYAWRPALWWVVAAAMFIGSAAHFARRGSGLGWALALGAFFLGGALLVQVRTGARHLDTGIQPFADRQEVQILAHITQDGRLQRAGPSEIRETLEVETEEIRTEAGELVPVHSGIRLSVYSPRSADAPEESLETSLAESNRAMPVFHYGQRIRFFAKLRLPRNFRNPGAFDYQGYLADRGIAALGSTKIDDVELLSGFAGSRFAAWRSRMHRCVIAKVHELWPPREAALD